MERFVVMGMFPSGAVAVISNEYDVKEKAEALIEPAMKIYSDMVMWVEKI